MPTLGILPYFLKKVNYRSSGIYYRSSCTVLGRKNARCTLLAQKSWHGNCVHRHRALFQSIYRHQNSEITKMVQKQLARFLILLNNAKRNNRANYFCTISVLSTLWWRKMHQNGTWHDFCREKMHHMSARHFWRELSINFWRVYLFYHIFYIAVNYRSSEIKTRAAPHPPSEFYHTF